MSRRVASPFVALDHSRCEACWECIAVCPESVFDKIEVWRHRHAVINAGDRCLGCAACASAPAPPGRCQSERAMARYGQAPASPRRDAEPA